MPKRIEFRVRDSETNIIIGYEFYNTHYDKYLQGLEIGTGYSYINLDFNNIKNGIPKHPFLHTVIDPDTELKPLSRTSKLVRELYTNFKDMLGHKIYYNDTVETNLYGSTRRLPVTDLEVAYWLIATKEGNGNPTAAIKLVK